MLSEIDGYDLILLDTGAGISEIFLQFSLLAEKNIVVINRELTSLTDANAIVKVMYQVFGRQAFSIIANNIKDEKEGSSIFKNIDTISRRFLGFPLHYLGHVQDDVVPKAILKQELAVLAFPHSSVNINFSQIGKAILDF